MPKRVLVIDAIATHRIRFAALLETARYRVDTAADRHELESVRRAYDLVLVGLPDVRPGQLVADVAKILEGTGTPMLCLDGKSSPLRRLVALRAGGRDILPTKSPDDLVLALVRSLIRRGEAEREVERRRLTAASFGFADAGLSFQHRSRVLSLGDLGKLPGRLSALFPHDIVPVPEGADLGEYMTSHRPDAILLATGKDPFSLRRTLPELRDQTHLSPVPVMAVYPEPQPYLATEALALGASEVLVATAGLEEFELRIADMLARKGQDDALRRADEQSCRMAATDPLTGLYNRRYADAYLASLTVRDGRDGKDYSVVLMDLDHFKAVNDTHGHAAGDLVLREVAARLKDNLRACDLVARYGGEEFLIVLPETSCSTATLLAERLRSAVASRAVTLPDGRGIHVTASIGVAAGVAASGPSAPPSMPSDAEVGVTSDRFRTTFDAADAALYRAKSTGRDRVEVSAA